MKKFKKTRWPPRRGGLSWGNWHWVRGSACGFGLDVWWDWPSVAGAHPWLPVPGSHPLQQEFIVRIDRKIARNYSGRVSEGWLLMVHSDTNADPCLQSLTQGQFYGILSPLEPGPVVKKKKMSPCSIWQGLWPVAQERRYLCVHKRWN